MIPRNQPADNDASLPANVRKARKTLAERGWSYRAFCAETGYSFTHVAHVLTGRRESRRLLEAIEALPKREEVGA